MGGDRLVYAGQIGDLLELEMSHGLVNADHHVFHYDDAQKSRHHLRTAYITFGSHLIGTTMGTNGFEKEHKVTLVAVSRRGCRIEESPREVKLRAGDTLLLESLNELKTDTQSMSADLHFFESEEIPNIGWGTLFSSLIMIAMVTLSALNVLPLLQCAILAVFAMFIFRCCTPEQAMRSINWDILMVFACSAVLGVAIQKTGIAEFIATRILDVCGTNPIAVMCAVCFAGTFITEFISNTAAGAMFFPIMYEAAEKMGYEPYPFMIALMIAVSSSFATPIGSPTHMLVYAPGGYRFGDFLRVGLPMNIIILAADIIIVNLIYPLTPLP
jgi:di/tricarboxylate transporter